ncbi:prostatic steroid-binding protein C1 [Cricetulus griseus]|uniref:prostatic steroid-binding protein C1 n=1 Tax=Cricetulus griseus TaxID=10029 RepID=UPI000454B710|nr:prostatic steroid-binding protein C1 [Cricetulus griseus]
MRLSLCLLLVILAVHCYEADAAMVCPAVIKESGIFVTGSEETLRKELEKYDAPPEAVEAKLEVKRCVDSKLSTLEKAEIAKVLGRDVLEAMDTVQATNPVQHILREQGQEKGLGRFTSDPLPMLDKPLVQRAPGNGRELGYF